MNRLIYIFLFIPILGFSQIQPQVGGLHEGGIVFYIDYDDNFMMISAPTDMIIDNYSTMWGGGIGYEWGCLEDSVIGADATDLGTGFQNTIDIINHGCFPYVNSNDFTAAHAASSYVHDNYDDWHLPSKDELEELAINNIITEGVYWSSSELPGENGGNDCWAYDCGQNQLILTDKRTTRKVRAIKTTVYEYINGCTDSLFVEYNPQANVDDGSCNITWEEQALIDIVDSLQTALITLNEDATTSLSSLQQALDTWNTAIDLSAGWNMFGYGCPTSITVSEGLSSYTEMIIIAKDNSGNVYLPEYDFNGIGNFTSGFGYQIKVTEEINNFSLCDWYVNDIPEDNILTLQEENAYLLAYIDSINATGITQIDPNAQQYNFNYVTTGTSHSIILPYYGLGHPNSSNNVVFTGDITEPFPVGSILGVFYTDYTNTLVCGGSTEWVEGSNQISAWLDDSSTPNIKDGFYENEPFIWFLLTPDGLFYEVSSIDLQTSNLDSVSNTFSPNSIYILTEIETQFVRQYEVFGCMDSLYLDYNEYANVFTDNLTNSSLIDSIPGNILVPDGIDDDCLILIE